MSRNIIFILLSVLLPAALLAQIPEKITYTEVGQTVPDFSFITLDGAEFDTQQLRGKIILLNFFATWCAPCMKEMPHLEKDIWQKYHKNNNFFLLAVGREHTKEQLRKFNEKKGFTFFIAPDTGRVIYSKFAKQMIPRNYLIDGNGKIVYQAIGYNKDDFQHLKNSVKSILEKEVK